MSEWLRKVFDIKEGEGHRAFLMFIYVFLIIASLLIIKPVRNSLFLTHLGVTKLPYAYILVAVSAGLIISLYSKYSNRIRLNRIMLIAAVVAIAFLILFYLLLCLNYRAGWFYYAFYVWVSIFGVLSTSNFWLLANYVFNAREAKRLFGFIGAGGIAGGIFGGYLTNVLAPRIGTKHMILFCVLFLSCCTLLLMEVWRRWARRTYVDRIHRERRTATHSAQESALKTVMRSKHLTYVAGVVGVGVIVANFVDYQFSAIASEVITEEDKLTAFFGFWLSNLSLVSLCVQLLLTSRILKAFGIMVSLFFLPIGIFIGALGILIQPAVWSAVLIKVSDGGFKHSINKSGLELLSLPIPSNVKNRAKAFIDVFVDSAATGCGGVLLILCMSYLGVAVQYISLIIIGFIGLWVYLITRVRREYVHSFRQALEKRSINLDDQRVNIRDASVVESLTHVLEGKNERQALYALQVIENVKNEIFIPHLKSLLHAPSSEIRVQVLRILNGYEDINVSTEVHQFVQDEDFEVRVEAMCYTMRHDPDGRQNVIERLNDSDQMIRTAAFLCVAREYKEDKAFRAEVDAKKLFHSFVDQCYQMDLEGQELDFLKMNIARVIGIVKTPELYPVLNTLLHDDSPKVIRAAIQSAGSTQDPLFVSTLVQHLNTNLVRLQARDALVEYGERIVDTLETSIEDLSQEKRIRIGVIRVLSFIGSQRSVNVLVKHLGHSDLQLRYEIVKALNKLKGRFPNLKLDKQLLQSRILDEIRQYYRIVRLLHRLSRSDRTEHESGRPIGQADQPTRARDLLIQALEEKLDVYLKLIFRLLGLRYLSREIYDAYLGIVSSKEDLRASAVEFLDNILDLDLKRLIIPLIEETAPHRVVQKTQHLFDVDFPTERDSLEFLLHSEDSWLKVCAVYYIAELKDEHYRPHITTLVDDSDPVVQETAHFYLERVTHGE
jgi:AAA family ATP:ADP antiporter